MTDTKVTETLQQKVDVEPKEEIKTTEPIKEGETDKPKPKTEKRKRKKRKKGGQAFQAEPSPVFNIGAIDFVPSFLSKEDTSNGPPAAESKDKALDTSKEEDTKP